MLIYAYDSPSLSLPYAMPCANCVQIYDTLFSPVELQTCDTRVCLLQILSYP